MDFKLKVIPEDFIVKEKHNLRQENKDTSQENIYFLLQKKNYETFEAISIIANFFKIEQNKIGYAGLKDCDGVTEQYISINADSLREEIKDSRESCYNIVAYESKFIRLYHTGKVGGRINVASLEGNHFNITVRDIDASICNKINDNSCISMSFINYYDTQRFGIPGGEKVTHFLGAAIERKDYTSAITLINRIKDSQDIVERPLNSIDDFFARIDLRKIAFYRSAYSSFNWNAQIIERLENSHKIRNSIISEIEGIKFVFPLSIDDSVENILKNLQYKYKRHVVIDNKIVPIDTNRPAIINTNVMLGKSEPDEFNHGKYKFRLSFFLPSGCYATMLIKQLVAKLQA
ncbi:tRNA pseudouridine(13) synthase TruD [Serratia quinivorans]|uniref:tRNA pseudouridine(13) synthase TruD n=1 Tax=Serratia quinivorans TaxID=137545 RepID=UPI00217A11E6|nr:tRNA pseudouridine(13) synthase TruD [Serratia quinivorans]CAI0942521.1 tRNA pseudouridine synthase D [Serratia quinivorans]CAI1740544.1 tRNA pseudouridine synthase D [Serratia quinivorans]